MKKVSNCKHFLMWLFFGKRLLLTDDNKLTCPRCKSKLKKIAKEDVVIDVCPFCHGMWLDDGEIDKLSSMVKKNGKKTKSK